MDQSRITRIANKVAGVRRKAEDTDALKNVDQAFDAIAASLISLDENIGDVKPENAAQEAALDVVKGLLDEALKPYMADVLSAWTPFEE
jgi:cell shape-determining protein MreC